MNYSLKLIICKVKLLIWFIHIVLSTSNANIRISRIGIITKNIHFPRTLFSKQHGTLLLQESVNHASVWATAANWNWKSWITSFWNYPVCQHNGTRCPLPIEDRFVTSLTSAEHLTDTTAQKYIRIYAPCAFQFLPQISTWAISHDKERANQPTY